MPSKTKDSLVSVAKVSISESMEKRTVRKSQSSSRSSVKGNSVGKNEDIPNKSLKIGFNRPKTVGTYRDVYESSTADQKRKMELTKEYRFLKVQKEYVKERRSRRQSQKQLTNRRFPFVDVRNADLVEKVFALPESVSMLVEEEACAYKLDDKYLLGLVNSMREQNNRSAVEPVSDLLAHLIAVDIASRPLMKGLQDSKLVSTVHEMDSTVSGVLKKDGLFGARAFNATNVSGKSGKHTWEKGMVVFIETEGRGSLGVISAAKLNDVQLTSIPQFEVQTNFIELLQQDKQCKTSKLDTGVHVGNSSSINLDISKQKVTILSQLVVLDGALHFISLDGGQMLRVHDRQVMPCPAKVPHMIPDLWKHLQNQTHDVSEALATLDVLYLIEKITSLGLSPYTFFSRALIRRANLFRVLNDVYSDLKLLCEAKIPLQREQLEIYEQAIYADQQYHTQVSTWRQQLPPLRATNHNSELKSSYTEKTVIPTAFAIHTLVKLYAVVREEQQCPCIAPLYPLQSTMVVYDSKTKQWRQNVVCSMNVLTHRVALGIDTGIVKWVSLSQTICAPCPLFARETAAFQTLRNTLHNTIKKTSSNEFVLVLTADWNKRGQIPIIQIDRRLKMKSRTLKDPQPHLDDSDFEDKLTDEVQQDFVDARIHLPRASLFTDDHDNSEEKTNIHQDLPYHERLGLTKKQLRNRFKRVHKTTRPSDQACFCCNDSLHLDKVHSTVMCMGRDGIAPLRASALTRCIRCGNQAHTACYDRYTENMEKEALYHAVQIYDELVYVKNSLIANLVKAHYDLFSRGRQNSNTTTAFNNALDKVPLSVRMCVVQQSGEAPPPVEEILAKVTMELIPGDARCEACSICEICKDPGLTNLLTCAVCHVMVHSQCIDEEVQNTKDTNQWVCQNCFACRDCNAHKTSQNVTSTPVQINKFLSSLLTIAAPHINIKLPVNIPLKLASSNRVCKPHHTTILEYVNDNTPNITTSTEYYAEESIVSPDYPQQAKSLASALKYSRVPYITSNSILRTNSVPRYNQDYFHQEICNLVTLSEVITIDDFLLINAITEVTDVSIPRVSYICKHPSSILLEECKEHVPLLAVPSQTECVPSGSMCDDTDPMYSISTVSPTMSMDKVNLAMLDYRTTVANAAQTLQLSPGIALLYSISQNIRKPLASHVSIQFTPSTHSLVAITTSANTEYSVPVYHATLGQAPDSVYPVCLISPGEVDRFVNKYIASNHTYTIPSALQNFSAYVLRLYTAPELPPPPAPPVGSDNQPICTPPAVIINKSESSLPLLSRLLNNQFSCEINLLDPKPNCPLLCTDYMSSFVHAVTLAYTGQIKNFAMESHEGDYGYILCRRCALQVHDGKECPLCCHGWFDDVPVEMIECGTCNRWVHSRCDYIGEGEMQQASEAAIKYDCRECLQRKRMSLLVRVLNAIEDADTNAFFLHNVTEEELPGYFDIIKIPMCFDTVRSKLQQLQYTTVDDFRYDLNLICRNAREYNGDDSIVTQTSRQQQLMAAPLLRFVENLNLRDLDEEKGVLSSTSNTSEKKAHAFKAVQLQLDRICEQAMLKEAPVDTTVSIMKLHPNEFVGSLLPSFDLEVVGPGFQLNEQKIASSRKLGSVLIPRFRQLISAISRVKPFPVSEDSKQSPLVTGTLFDWALLVRSATNGAFIPSLLFPRSGRVHVPLDPCILCGSNDDAVHTMTCEKCRVKVHSYCLVPHTNIANNTSFLCDDCVTCTHCKTDISSFQTTLHDVLPNSLTSTPRLQQIVEDAMAHSVGISAPPAVLQHNPASPLAFTEQTRVEPKTRQILRCHDCFQAFHPSCVPTWLLEASAQSMYFVCAQCIHCVSCKSTPKLNSHRDQTTRDAVIHLLQLIYPGCNILPILHELCDANVCHNTSVAKWDTVKKLCPVCSLLISNGQSCGLCHESYAGSSSIAMAQCDACNQWVHLACEGVTDESLSSLSYFLCKLCRFPGTHPIPRDVHATPVTLIDPARCHLHNLDPEGGAYLSNIFYKQPLMRPRVNMSTPRSKVIEKQRKLTQSFHSLNTNLNMEHYGCADFPNIYTLERNVNVEWCFPHETIAYKSKKDSEPFYATAKHNPTCYMGDINTVIPLNPLTLAYSAVYNSQKQFKDPKQLANGKLTLNYLQTALSHNSILYCKPDYMLVYNIQCPPLLFPMQSPVEKYTPEQELSVTTLFNPLYYDPSQKTRYDCSNNYKFYFLDECPVRMNLTDTYHVLDALLQSSNPVPVIPHFDPSFLPTTFRSAMVYPLLVYTVLTSTSTRTTTTVKSELVMKEELSTCLKRKVQYHSNNMISTTPKQLKRTRNSTNQATSVKFPLNSLHKLGMCVPANILVTQSTPLLTPKVYWKTKVPQSYYKTHNSTSMKSNPSKNSDFMTDKPLYLVYDYHNHVYKTSTRLSQVFPRDASQLNCNAKVRSFMRSKMQAVYNEHVLSTPSVATDGCAFANLSSNQISLLTAPVLNDTVLHETNTAVIEYQNQLSCVLCNSDAHGVLGRMLPVGTIPSAFCTSQGTGFESGYAHEQCLLWCFFTQPEVVSDTEEKAMSCNWASPMPVLGASTPVVIRNVPSALAATHSIVCTHCQKPGASIPCCGFQGVGSTLCGHVMHLPCALEHNFSFFRVNMQCNNKILSNKLTFCEQHTSQVAMYMPSDVLPSTSIYQFQVNGVYPARIIVPANEKHDFNVYKHITKDTVNIMKCYNLLSATSETVTPPTVTTEYILDTTGLEEAATAQIAEYSTNYTHTHGTQIGSMVIRSFGQVLPLHTAFHTSTSIIPFGFSGTNYLPSVHTANTMDVYTLTVGAVEDKEHYKNTKKTLSLMEKTSHFSKQFIPAVALQTLRKLGKVRVNKSSGQLSSHLRDKQVNLSILGNEADTHSMLSSLNDQQVRVKVIVRPDIPVLSALEWNQRWKEYISVLFEPRKMYIPLYTIQSNTMSAISSTSVATLCEQLRVIAQAHKISSTLTASKMLYTLGLMHPSVQGYHQLNPHTSALRRYNREAVNNMAISTSLQSSGLVQLTTIDCRDSALLQLFGLSPGCMSLLGQFSRHAMNYDVTIQALLCIPEILKTWCSSLHRYKHTLPLYGSTKMQEMLYFCGTNSKSNLTDNNAYHNPYAYWTKHVAEEALPCVSSLITTGQLSYSQETLLPHVLQALTQSKHKLSKELYKILSKLQSAKNHVTKDKIQRTNQRLATYNTAEYVDCAMTLPISFNYRGTLQLGLNRYSFAHLHHRNQLSDIFAHEAACYSHKGATPECRVAWTRANMYTDLPHTATLLPTRASVAHHGISSGLSVKSTLLHGQTVPGNTPMALLSQYTAPQFVTVCRTEHQFGASARAFNKFLMPKYVVDAVAGKKLVTNVSIAAMYVKHDDTVVTLDDKQCNITGHQRLFPPRLYSPFDNLRSLYTQYQILLNTPDYAAPIAGHSVIHMWGQFTTRPYSKDQMIIEYQGEQLHHPMPDKREIRYEAMDIDSCYMFMVNQRLYVDSTRKGNASRFVNHSCDPNCYTQILDGKIVIFAKQDIEAGVEQTYDYCFSTEDERITCTCGSEKCSGRLN